MRDKSSKMTENRRSQKWRVEVGIPFLEMIEI